MELTQAYLKSILHYDQESGLFTWGKNRDSTRIGAVAGTTNASGYVVITHKKRKYYAHRLAWLYVTGCWPADEIDHRDVNPSNNKWDNLREATHSQNHRNRKGIAKHGYKGVTQADNRWRAQIQVGGVRKHLGSFKTPEEAHEAYKAAAIHLSGSFARFD